VSPEMVYETTMASIKDEAGKKRSARARPGWLRFLPLALLVAALIAFVVSGARKFFSFEYLLTSREWLVALIAAHGALAFCGYIAIYTAAVALSVPGASVLTIAGGFLFGGLAGGVAAVLAATSGATILFLAARGSLGVLLRDRAGPWLETFRRGFEEDAVSYMLFLRLTPVFPFWLVNLAPALIGAKLRTFIWTTFLGILPGTFAFAFAGAGLDSVAAARTKAFEECLATGATDCRAHIYLNQLVTRELIFALAGLGVVALIPVVARRWRAKSKK
jgi:uncharacterized membrane protein YdjX (TVP38/TMEM64 family)